jgi:RNA polymerase primary sigma factor
MTFSDDFELEEFKDSAEYNSNQLDLREWQIKAKSFFFNNNSKAIFEVATGAGKTFIAIDIINEVLKTKPDTKVLIVVPKNVILETGWYKEMSDYGIPIQKIGVFFGEVKEYAQFTLTNMQSFDKVPLELFDFLILDEVHGYATERMLDLIRSRSFKYMLGLSATLKRLDNKHTKLLKIFDYNVFEYKPETALLDNVLNPFKFYNIGLTLDSDTFDKYTELSTALNSIFHQYGSFNNIMKTQLPIKHTMLSLMSERKKLVNNYYVKFEVASQIINQFKDNKIIVFNQFNDQTSRMYWYLLDYGIKCNVIHSGISKTEREKNLIGFKLDKFNVLLTSKVLDEGYNLPKLDIAIIMAGDSTEKQTVQRMGRVLRKKDTYSKLVQVYCKKTFEERNSQTRAEMFKEMSVMYTDIDYTTGTILKLI